MATFNYTVDTKPMAAEIGSVSNHVMATTTAVVAMQTAVVLAEAQAATHICNNVNKGFYTLMHSQLSQKIAQLQSEVDSHFMKLAQLKKGLMGIKNRMERDYNMISNRYLKIFNGLNANLKQRVFELDRPVMSFAIKEVEQISNRTKYLTATVPVSQAESLSISQKIIASNVKYRVLNVINSMKNFLKDMSEQKKLTNRILFESYESGEVKSPALSIPVIIGEFNHDKYDNKYTKITVSNVELSEAAKSVISNVTSTAAQNLLWQAAKEIDKEVKSEFSKLLASSPAEQRVKDMANRLFMANNYQTIKSAAL
ncbi:MAG: hypothetical protein LBF67_08250 [Prevotellaceae bacterium]|jgi:hypothetical protein|nr:hypothetical protein [Prevotellaceae bacterium]